MLKKTLLLMFTTKRTFKFDGTGEGRTQAPPTRESLHGHALAMLARREHSAGEIRKKLNDIGGDADLIEDVISQLQVRNLQSDVRFSESYVRSRAERGYGPRVIEMGLRDRGIDRESARLTLESSGYDWCEQAIDLRQRRFGADSPTAPKERARQLRFLQYRGFAGREISAAFKGEVSYDD